MSGTAIFDLDATLVDSVATAKNAFSDAFLQCGLAGDPPVAAFMALSGMPLEQVCAELGLPVDIFPELFREASRQRANDLRLFPGVLNILNSLYHHGVSQAIITGKDRVRTFETMRLLGIDQYFSCVVTPDDPPAPKPSPDGVLWICKQLDTAPRESVVIGDSILDVRAGRLAGAVTVGCTWGIAGRTALLIEGSDFIAESVDELTKFIFDKFQIGRITK